MERRRGLDKEKDNSMMNEILETFIAIFFTLLTGWFAWQSTLLVQEKKQRERNEKDNNIR